MIKHTVTTFKTITVFLLVTLYLSSFSLCLPGYEKNEIKFRDDIMSVNIHEIPLKQILEKIKREKGIWFNEISSLLDKKVSVYFNDLPLEKGLNRLLYDFNYALLFDKNSRTEGIIILGIKNNDKNSNSDNLNFNKSLNNNTKDESPKDSNVLLFPKSGEEAPSRYPEDSKGIGQFPPSKESLSNQNKMHNLQMPINPFDSN